MEYHRNIKTGEKIEKEVRVRIMVFNATYNNISVVSWWSVLLIEETRVLEENHQPAMISQGVPIFRPITLCRQQIACNSVHLLFTVIFLFYLLVHHIFNLCTGLLRSWSYCCCIYNYLCNQWLSLITPVSSIYKLTATI